MAGIRVDFGKLIDPTEAGKVQGVSDNSLDAYTIRHITVLLVDRESWIREYKAVLLRLELFSLCMV